MSGDDPSGPPVDAAEDLYRAVLNASVQWVKEAGRPSSALFDAPKFSVDIASLTTPQKTASRFNDVEKLVQFNCGRARSIGFDTRYEPEQGNDAHANVYFQNYSGQSHRERKTKARKLAEMCEEVDF